MIRFSPRGLAITGLVLIAPVALSGCLPPDFMRAPPRVATVTMSAPAPKPEAGPVQKRRIAVHASYQEAGGIDVKNVAEMSSTPGSDLTLNVPGELIGGVGLGTVMGLSAACAPFGPVIPACVAGAALTGLLLGAQIGAFSGWSVDFKFGKSAPRPATNPAEGMDLAGYVPAGSVLPDRLIRPEIVLASSALDHSRVTPGVDAQPTGDSEPVDATMELTISAAGLLRELSSDNYRVVVVTHARLTRTVGQTLLAEKVHARRGAEARTLEGWRHYGGEAFAAAVEQESYAAGAKLAAELLASAANP